MKITTEIQLNVKLLHLLNEKVICSTLTEKKKYKFAPKLDAATLAGARKFLILNGSRYFSREGFAHLLSFVPTENY